MDRRIQSMIERIRSGKDFYMDSQDKNLINSILADGFSIGDLVKEIKTGKCGIVTGKIKYDRENHNCISVYGYTAIQVDMDGHKRNYAPRSLVRL